MQYNIKKELEDFMKKIISVIMLCIMVLSFGIDCFAFSMENNAAEIISKEKISDFNLDIPLGGVYLCESSTGKVLYAENEFKAAPIASVTKIMTLLLVCEAIDEGRINLKDEVRISAKAASMGGSQVFLKEGERITVEELLKATVIASGNDSSVALAELCFGSEAAFVKRMNSRAAELGLKNTHFENTTGLDDTVTNHYSCAADVATISRELIKHELILKYSSTWQDSIRNGEFVLTNTNRLVRYYDGCNGLKTGSTDRAGYCVSASAKRDNMQLIAVVLGADSKDDRNNAARELLDYGFANYSLFCKNEEFVENTTVTGGISDIMPLYSKGFRCVVPKSGLKNINSIYDIPQEIQAPVSEGQIVGRITYKLGDEQIGYSDIYAAASCNKITFKEIYFRIIKRIICG